MVELKEQPNICVHCNKKFMHERTLYSHMCEGKRRAMQRNEKRVQTGLIAFNRFYQLTQNSKKDKTYEEFCKSPYYNAFVKFGSFINNVGPLYPDQFIDFVIRSGVKIDHWCKDSLYEKYLFEMIKLEPVEAALQRSLQTMMEWADISQAQFNHYFEFVNHNRAVHDILNGKISPWLILNCEGGKKLINGFSDDQLDLIAPAFDLPYWLQKFKKVPSDIILVKEVCKEAGIK